MTGSTADWTAPGLSEAPTLERVERWQARQQFVAARDDLADDDADIATIRAAVDLKRFIPATVEQRVD